MRDHILNEIKRLAAASGESPGKQVFARETGIKEGQWSGVFWARWSDALSEAGLENNKLQGRFVTEDVLDQIAKACRSYAHFPTSAEMKLYRRANPSFPSHGAIANHFPSRSDLLAALTQYVGAREKYQDVALLLPEVRQTASLIHKQRTEGFVYLYDQAITTKLVEVMSLSDGLRRSASPYLKPSRWSMRSKRMILLVSKRTGIVVSIACEQMESGSSLDPMNSLLSKNVNTSDRN